MRWFRWLWLLHRWLGLAAGLVLLLSAATGYLLLVKKDFAWLQPPVAVGEPGPPERLQPLAAVYAVVFALGVPELRGPEDIGRIDFRPAQGLHKVVSRRGHVEVQVCATTLRTSGPARRASDWLEQLHDGSWFGAPMHGAVMPAAALVLVYLALSGYVMWAWPKWQKRQRPGAASPPRR